MQRYFCNDDNSSLAEVCTLLSALSSLITSSSRRSVTVTQSHKNMGGLEQHFNGTTQPSTCRCAAKKLLAYTLTKKTNINDKSHLFTGPW